MARWDETEVISLKSCARTLTAFLRGRCYRHSPVSALYVEARCQDFALQRARQIINERLHLRLWLTPLRYRGKPVWIGQVSRDIGVRFTLRTWNLTTHKIDPDVDDARDYVLGSLMESGRVARVGYVPGVGATERTSPRHNLTGDPYFTDGLRAVAVFSPTRTEPAFLNWMQLSQCLNVCTRSGDRRMTPHKDKVIASVARAKAELEQALEDLARLPAFDPGPLRMLHTH